MNQSAKATYRVQVVGLTTTERMAFSGMLRLAERNGACFQLEATLERTDIFILDGTERRSVELAEAHREVASRAIWVDPPAHFQSGRQVSRPLRWLALLQLMEQTVGINRKITPSDVPPPDAEMTPEQMCHICEDVLRPHIGIAAEFVLEDVQAELKRRVSFDGPITAAVFLRIVHAQLPGNLDAKGIINEMSLAIARGVNS